MTEPLLHLARGREVWQWPSVESILADIRFVLRELLKSPVLSGELFVVCSGVPSHLGGGRPAPVAMWAMPTSQATLKARETGNSP